MSPPFLKKALLKAPLQYSKTAVPKLWGQDAMFGGYDRADQAKYFKG